MRELAKKQEEAGQYLEQQSFDPSFPGDDVKTWEKKAKAYAEKLAADRVQLDKLLAEAAALRAQIAELNDLDAKIAVEYGLSPEELARMMSPDLLDESRWAQQEAVEGSLWLANAQVGYAQRAAAQAQAYLKTWQTIREEQKVVPNLWGTNPEGRKELDELDAILLGLENATTGAGSSLGLITLNALASQKETIDLIEGIKNRQGNNYGDPVQLALERINAWRLKSGNTPANGWGGVWAKQADAFIGAQQAAQQVLNEAKEHSAWMRWVKDRGGFLGDDDDGGGSDPNPFIPI